MDDPGSDVLDAPEDGDEVNATSCSKNETRPTLDNILSRCYFSALLENPRARIIRTEVLADFWSEMMLYIAPSDDVNEHIDQLTQGGEFITHLWALLSHAGILQRDQPSTAPSHQPHAESVCASEQEIEQDSTSHEEATTSLAHHLVTISPPHHLADNPQMIAVTLQGPPQDILQVDRFQQVSVPPEITEANECHINVTEASSFVQENPP